MKVSCCAQTRVAGSSLPTVKSDCLWWSPLFSRCLRLCKSANKHGMKTFCKETGCSRTNSNFFGFFVCFCFCFCFFFLRVWNLQSLTDHLGTKDEQTIIFSHCSFCFLTSHYQAFEVCCSNKDCSYGRLIHWKIFQNQGLYPGYHRFFSRAAWIFGICRRPTHLRP